MFASVGSVCLGKPLCATKHFPAKCMSACLCGRMHVEHTHVLTVNERSLCDFSVYEQEHTKHVCNNIGACIHATLASISVCGMNMFEIFIVDFIKLSPHNSTSIRLPSTTMCYFSLFHLIKYSREQFSFCRSLALCSSASLSFCRFSCLALLRFY